MSTFPEQALTTDPVLHALVTEIERAMGAITGPEAPYYIALRALDRSVLGISAVDGALVKRGWSRKRALDVSVRVGSPARDSTHPLKGSWDRVSPVRVRLPIEDDEIALRMSVWMALRTGIAEARERWIRVYANQAVRARDEDPSPDFSAPGEPILDLRVPLSVEVDEAHWEAQVRALSREASAHDIVERSRAGLDAIVEQRWFVATDGTQIRHPRTWARIAVSAETTAAEGGELSSYHWADATSVERLPDEQTLARWSHAVRDEIVALRQAPMGEPYRGPVLLRGRAAGVFVHEVLGHRIEGHRQKDDEEGQTFRGMVGQPILLPSISVADDPTLQHAAGADLNGHYLYDEEGIPATRVEIVNAGVFSGFVMSRSPIRGFAHSNGHGRAASGFSPVSRMANTVISTTEPVPADALVSRLREEIAAQGLPYGIIVDEIDGGFTLTGRSMPNTFSVQASVAHRVWADGRPDELVRGLDLVGTPLAALGQLLAAGDDPVVFNGFCGAESGMVPNSVVSPSLLLRSLEAQRQERGTDQPPLLAAPHSPKDDALRDELQRAQTALHIEGTSAPYHISAQVADYTETEIIATLGSLILGRSLPRRSIAALVRVGSPTLDNTNFESWDPGHAAESLSLDDDPRADSRKLWRLLDRCYKGAVETLASKEAARRRHPADPGALDFAPGPPVRVQALPSVRPDTRRLEDIARTLSEVLRHHRLIEWSRVYALAGHGRLRSLDTGGTDVSVPIDEVAVRLVARVRAGDGEVGLDQALFVARTVDTLPIDAMLDEARALAERLEAWAALPALREELVGPVWFAGEAASALFRWLLLPVIRGTPPMMLDPDGRQYNTRRPERSVRLKRRILPPGWQIIDDPSAQPSHPASYTHDLEGVPASRVVIVEDGVLRAHLMSQIPCRGERQSTGHARAALGDLPRAQCSMLRIKGPAHDALHAEALRLARGYGADRYVEISRMRQASLARLPMKRETTTGIIGEDLEPPVPVEVALVDEGGRRTAVRGLGIAHLDISALTSALAGRQSVYTSFLESQPGWDSDISALGGMPIAISCPDLLLSEVELTPSDQTEQLPNLSSPLMEP